MSDGITIDLTNYKDRVGSRVPEADYNVVVEDTEDDKSKAGNDMVNVWFRIIDGPEAGATIIDRLVLTEKSLFRVVGFLQAIGVPTPKKKFKIPHNAIRGRRLVITVEDGEPYNGRTKSEVRGYSKFAGEVADEEVQDLPDAPAAEVAVAAPVAVAAEVAVAAPAAAPVAVAEVAPAAVVAEAPAPVVTEVSLADVDL